MSEVRLIDANALKAEFKKMENYHSLKLPYDDVIDNAPTVDLTKNQAYDKGFITAMKLYSRPQGEWEESHIFSCGNILRMGMNVIEHKCKNCGRWSIKWVGTKPDSFCSNCGAKMKI